MPWCRAFLLLPYVAAQSQTILHETFDWPFNFTKTNHLGEIPFYSNGEADYFGASRRHPNLRNLRRHGPPP
jgi:hypothetical protein